MQRMRHIILQEPFRAVFYAPIMPPWPVTPMRRPASASEVRAGTQPSLAKDAVLEGHAHLAWGGPMRILLT